MIGLFGFHSNGNRAAHARWMFRNGPFDRVELLNHAAFPASGRTSSLDSSAPHAGGETLIDSRGAATA
jgi:hypothetical protein